jgi:hypothetical protein
VTAAATDIDSMLRAAVRAIMADMERRVAPGIVEARGVEQLKKICVSDERPSERYRRENAEVLRQMAALGNVRGVALKAAQRLSKHDPSAQHRLAQRFRRILREKK